MSQVLELEVNIDDGDATCDGQDDDITAQNLLYKEKGRRRKSDQRQGHRNSLGMYG